MCAVDNNKTKRESLQGLRRGAHRVQRQPADSGPAQGLLQEVRQQGQLQACQALQQKWHPALPGRPHPACSGGHPLPGHQR